METILRVRFACAWIIVLAFVCLPSVHGKDRKNPAATEPAQGVATSATTSAKPGDLTPGVWTQVTPGDFEPRTFGTQSIAADPVRPGEFYLLGSGQGIWKTTDFGATWLRIQPQGFMYMMTVEANPKRDAKTPPLLWACAGYGKGIARSLDGGTTWTNYKVDNAVVKSAGDHQRANDIYDIESDPTDSRHVLCTFHGAPGISESHDGGQTWTTIKAADGALGVSLYVFFTDPAPAEKKAGATFSSTWLAMCQAGSKSGIARTADGGATFTPVNRLQHSHGNAQAFTAGDGVVYLAGSYGDRGNGIYRSADFGVTWEKVNDGTVQNGIYASDKFIYADNGWSTAGRQNQKLQRAPRATGTKGTWTNYYPDAPMTNGSGHAAVSSDGKHAIILTANRTSGVWRYVEP